MNRDLKYLRKDTITILVFLACLLVSKQVGALETAAPRSRNTSFHQIVNSNADYSEKVVVKVGEVLTQHAAVSAASATQGRIRSAMGPRSIGVESLQSNLQQDSVSKMSIGINHFDGDSLFHRDADKFGNVNVNVFGETINVEALNYLQPDLTYSTISKLRIILGEDFDASWMSTEVPSYTNQTRADDSNPIPSENMIAEVNRLNLFDLVQRMGFDQKSSELLRRQTDIMRRWFIERATCPMEFVWRDLGNRFWPQWIKHVVCNEVYSCSWPPGMHCKPDGSKSLRILKWQCKKSTANSELRRIKRQHTTDLSEPEISLFGKAGVGFHERIQRRPPDVHFFSVPHNRAKSRRRRITREDRQSKRVKRLVKKLSRTSRGYYCEWIRDVYSLQPTCSCSCSHN